VIFEKCAKLHLPRLVQFWHIFQKSLVVLIVNCTPSRVITYANRIHNSVANFHAHSSSCDPGPSKFAAKMFNDMKFTATTARMLIWWHPKFQPTAHSEVYATVKKKTQKSHDRQL
jgi:hypothetical protein